MSVKLALALGALLEASASTICLAAPANPLIGNWQLVKDGCDTVTKISYSPNKAAFFQPPDGIYPGWRTIGVQYNISKSEIWILPIPSFGANSTRVFPVDDNHIMPDDGFRCVYQRVK